ncbi:Cell cycle checkpoint protein rad17 [Irineochytrium annulatum]|nr:Cell cycle checkpoint protein rad17 [Irineochytrium annulatum]
MSDVEDGDMDAESLTLALALAEEEQQLGGLDQAQLFRKSSEDAMPRPENPPPSNNRKRKTRAVVSALEAEFSRATGSSCNGGSQPAKKRQSAPTLKRARSSLDMLTRPLVKRSAILVLSDSDDETTDGGSGELEGVSRRTSSHSSAKAMEIIAVDETTASESRSSGSLRTAGTLAPLNGRRTSATDLAAGSRALRAKGEGKLALGLQGLESQSTQAPKWTLTQRAKPTAKAKPPAKSKGRRRPSQAVDVDEEKDHIESDFDGMEDLSQASRQPSSQAVCQASLKRWIIPETGSDFGSLSQTSLDPQKSQQPAETALWIDKFEPKTEDELWVNKKKTAEVRSWLAAAMRGNRSRHRALDAEPLYDPTDKRSGWTPTDEKTPMQIFVEFLNVSRKTPCLQFESLSVKDDEATTGATNTNGPKIIIIEDLPNVSNVHTRSAFQTCLRDYINSPRSLYPVVIILTDTPTSSDKSWVNNSNELPITFRTLVPEELVSSGACTKISFNSIGVVFLGRFLNKFAERLGVSKLVTKAQVEEIARQSGGDIRCALNALQFFSLGLNRFPPVPTKSKRRKKGEAAVSQASFPISLDYIGGREVNLNVFHALGKILQSKRIGTSEASDIFPGKPADTVTVKSTVDLPASMKRHHRPPAKSNPEHVYDACDLDAGAFSMYLFENYPSHLTDIEECVTASHYMAISDTVMGPWEKRSIISSYATSIASRGIMFSRVRPAPPLKFGSLKVPGLFKVIKETGNARGLLRSQSSNWRMNDFTQADGFALSHSHPISVLAHEMIPYIAKIHQAVPRQMNMQPHDVQMLSSLTRYSYLGAHSTFRTSEPLRDERDIDPGGCHEDEQTMETARMDLERDGGVQLSQVADDEDDIGEFAD